MTKTFRGLWVAILLVFAPGFVQAGIDSAVDTPGWVWTQSGNADWFESFINFYSRDSRARSGNIGNLQESSISTAVVGPGEISFVWSVSSEASFDKLRFYIGGDLQNSISGERWWHVRSYLVPAGPHTLKWKFVKDVSNSVGSDAGFLDQVMFIPTGSVIATTWTMKPMMPQSRAGLVVANDGNQIYAIGGFDGGYYSDNDALDGAGGGSWSARMLMPTMRADAAAAVHNGNIYVFGGRNGPTRSENERYDASMDVWLTRAPMLNPRYGLAATESRGLIYLIGGVDGGGAVTSLVSAYDVGGNFYAGVFNMPTARKFLAAATVNNKVYAIGGQDSANNPLGTVEEYDPGTGGWTSKADMPTPRYNFGVAVVHGRIFAVGGATASGVTGVIEQYDPVSDTWALAGRLSVPREQLGVATMNGKLYVIGGTTGGAAWSGEVEEGVIVILSSGSFVQAGQGEVTIAPNVMNRSLGDVITIVVQGNSSGEAKVRIYSEVGAYMGELGPIRLDGAGRGTVSYAGERLERELGVGLYWALVEGGGVDDRQPFIIKSGGR